MEVNARKLEEALRRLQFLNTPLIHETIGEELRIITEERFDSSIDPSGIPWEPIQSYIYNTGQQKIKRRRGEPPLKGGGGSSGGQNLRDSFFASANAAEVQFGTASQIAKFHSDAPNNNGRVRTKIPLREFMGIESQEDINRILDVVRDAMSVILK